MTTWTTKLVGAAGLAALLMVGLGAQGAGKQKIAAQGLQFEAPADWKKVPATNSMRAVELKVEPTEGDRDPAELVMFAFPGGAGTVKQNVDRWQQQFQDESGKPPAIKTEEMQGVNVDVTFVETSGRYVAPVQIGRPERVNKPGYHLLGAIVTTPQTGYFIKMVGPEKTMQAARGPFLEMIKSLKVGN